jgi:hypothetical protein
MGKPKRKIFLYQDGEFLKECDSMLAASKYTGESTGCINDIVRNPHWSRKGFFYSYKELRPDELPDYNEKAIKVIPRKFTDYADEDIKCYIPAKKEKAKTDLRNFVHARLAQHWREIPAVVAKMERHYLQQLIDTL